MRITVLGTGYVGLVAGSCFSDTGNSVTCVDVDAKKVASLKKGEIPFFEPGLEEIVRRNVRAKRLTFSTSIEEAIASAEAVFIAVGTPSKPDGSWDLSYVFSAIDSVKTHAKGSLVVVFKSTVPVGTSDEARKRMKGSRFPVHFVSNPEFLKEGSAVQDFLKPERVILGTDSETGRRIVADLYAPFVRSGNPILFMDNRSAELAKYAANSFLAMKISFINDLAWLAENVGADIHFVRRAITTDSRIGKQFLYPGCGFGGSCFPKDLRALIQLGKQYGIDLDIFEAVQKTNDRQKQMLFHKIEKHFKKDLKGKTFAVWGLSFKPLTDDMREAPSLDLIEALLKKGARVQAYDPIATEQARLVLGDRVAFCEDPYEAAQGADALSLVTEWSEFHNPDFDRIKQCLKSPVIFDGRNVFNPETVQSRGFTYYCIGKPDPE